MGGLSKPQIFMIGVVTFCIAIALSMSALVEDVQEGHIVVRQVPFTGTIDAQSQPGVIGQWFGNIFTYKKAGTYDFSPEPTEDSVSGPSVKVRFNDGGTAEVEGKVRFLLPESEEAILRIHKDFRAYEHLVNTLIRPFTDEVLTKTASLMSTQESYTSKKSAFAEMVQDQLINGIYITESVEVLTDVDRAAIDTAEKRRIVVRVKIGEDGQPVRRISPFQEYGIVVPQVSLGKEMVYDPKSLAIIESARDAFQRRIQAQALAETAEQDRIKTEAEGKVAVEKARYELLEQKERATIKAQQEQEVATIEAQKKVDVAEKARQEADQLKQKAEVEANMRLEVARLDKQAADEERKAMIARGEGEAEARRLLFEADNALQMRLDAAIRMEQVWAEAFSMYEGKIVPDIMIAGGENGGITNGFEALFQMLSLREAKNLVKDANPDMPINRPVKTIGTSTEPQKK